MPHTAMKRRVHTWLIVVAGAIGLPLLAMCALQRAGALEPLIAGAATLARAGMHALEAGEPVAAPSPVDAPMSEPVLMSCADPEPVSASPLWCEDRGDGARCMPAAPERPSHDFGAPSPALACAPLLVPGAPVALLEPARRPARSQLHASRGASAGVERPPRA
jgi:hypothetical protein